MPADIKMKPRIGLGIDLEIWDFIAPVFLSFQSAANLKKHY